MTVELIDFGNIGLPPVRRVTEKSTSGWEKSYECPSVEAAGALAEHFRRQSAQLKHADRAALQSVGQRGFASFRVGHRPLTDDGRKTRQGPPEAPPDPWSLPEEAAGDQMVRTYTELLDPALWDQASPERLLWLRGMAAGLDALHRADWVHGDVKPMNACLDKKPGAMPVAMLVDFESASPMGALSPIASKAYWHPRSLARVGELAIGDAVANDRMGFFAIAVAAAFGAQMDTALFAGSAETAPDKVIALNQLGHQLPPASRRLVGAFVAALDDNAATLLKLSCTDWLDGLIALAGSKKEVSESVIKHDSVAGRIGGRLTDLRGLEPSQHLTAIVGAELVWPFLSGVLLVVAPALALFLLMIAIEVM